MAATRRGIRAKPVWARSFRLREATKFTSVRTKQPLQFYARILIADFGTRVHFINSSIIGVSFF